MIECSRKKYVSEMHANRVRDVLNRKPETKRMLYTTYCAVCKAYHLRTNK